MAGTPLIKATLDPRVDVSSTTAAGVRVGTNDVLIGRDAQYCSIVIDLPYVSRQHAKVSHCNGDFFLEDLESADGTQLNGNSIDPGRKYSLLDDDRVAIGDHVVVFESVPWFELEIDDKKPVAADANEVAVSSSEPSDASSPTTLTQAPPAGSQAPPDNAETAILAPGVAASAIYAPQMRVAVDAFLEGLRLPAEVVGDDESSVRQFMGMAGHMLHISLEGIRKALFTHDKFRDQYRIPGTVLARSQMNPLYNHQIDTTHVIEVLFSKLSEAIVDPVKAVEEATRDFYIHGIAVPVAVDQAIHKIFETFDWQALEGDFSARSTGVLLAPMRKARYWQWYCEEYDRRVKMLDEFDNDYRRAVGKAYSQARDQARAHEARNGER